MGIEADESLATVTGPIKIFRSSDFAERAWCDDCGSAIWFRYIEGASTGYFEFVPGLFDNAGDARLTRIVYADCAPEGYALAGEVERITKDEYERQFDHV